MPRLGLHAFIAVALLILPGAAAARLPSVLTQKQAGLPDPPENDQLYRRWDRIRRRAQRHQRQASRPHPLDDVHPLPGSRDRPSLAGQLQPELREREVHLHPGPRALLFAREGPLSSADAELPIQRAPLHRSANGALLRRKLGNARLLGLRDLRREVHPALLTLAAVISFGSARTAGRPPASIFRRTGQDDFGEQEPPTPVKPVCA